MSDGEKTQSISGLLRNSSDVVITICFCAFEAKCGENVKVQATHPLRFMILVGAGFEVQRACHWIHQILPVGGSQRVGG